jgi:hypothetical protein
MPLKIPRRTVQATSVTMSPVADPGVSIEEFIRLEAEAEATQRGYAHIMHERLMGCIADFERALNPNEEVAAYLASFGAQILIRIERVAYRNPYLIIFTGSDEQGRRVELVQHTTQLNVLFVAVPVEEPRPARRIGFHSDDNSKSKRNA